MPMSQEAVETQLVALRVSTQAILAQIDALMLMLPTVYAAHPPGSEKPPVDEREEVIPSTFGAGPVKQ